MLIKEYRISLPMSAEEYRIAQLYMIQKKSRVESHGAGSGVEILINEPYENGPGGNGQYTHKIYHIGSHLPGWFRAILPKSALVVEEEAWNAYPYTKTRYRCPFVEKFVLEIETKYLNDGGDQENIFNLSAAEMKERVLDIIDIVKDPISSGDYKQEEDPKLYQSTKTKRGPLNDNWREEYRRAIKDPNNKTIKLMTAYKLCRVEFKYWGMQTKIERFIHEIALRKTMLHAHRQAWCWQDEYYGLQLSDIRQLERETELALREKMADVSFEDESKNQKNACQDNITTHDSYVDNVPRSSETDLPSGTKYSGDKLSSSISPSKCSPSHHNPGQKTLETSRKERAMSLGDSGSQSLSNWRVQSLMHLQEASSDEEFYDAPVETLPVRSSSMECLSVSADEFVDAKSTLSSCTDLSTEPYTGRGLEKLCQKYSLDLLLNTEKHQSKTLDSQDKVLFLVIHGGSLLDTTEHGSTSKRSDFSTLKATFSTVMKAHYPATIGHIVFKLVPSPQICTDALNILSSLAPFGFDTTPMTPESNPLWTQEYIPLGTVALLSTSSADYKDHINTMVSKANLVYHEFLNSSEGKDFNGRICILGDSVGSLLAYDALCRSGSHLGGSHSSLLEQELYLSHEGQEEPESFQHASDCQSQHKGSDPNKHKHDSDVSGIIIHDTCDSHAEEAVLRNPHKTNISERLNVGCSEELPRYSGSGSGISYESFKFDFDVTDFFMFGSSLGIVLAQRRLNGDEDKTCPPQRPACHQVFNLFHSSDPTAVRIEPLIDFSFRHIPPVHVPRYTRFPMGDAESVHLVEAIYNNLHLISEHLQSSVSSQSLPIQRHASVTSTSSDLSVVEGIAVVSIANVSRKWWGSKRIDCVLYSPEILHSFPIPALPPLFHASFWESTDVAAFILRQVFRPDSLYGEMAYSVEKSPDKTLSVQDKQSKEKWQKRRTFYKVKNLQANHRGNDVLASEDKPQVLLSRFTYGPLDMTCLSGERIDIHVMDTLGEWNYMGTEVTDGNGRVSFTIPEDRILSQGIYPVKMVVRVDHTFADLFLAVLPPKTETVVFSVDGSFTASVSIMGKDPKVRAGAVDVVRYWQELGYLILYITARPDMQHRQVVSWFAQHNFPHGMVIFMDGFSKEPLRQKINYLRNLQQDVQLVYRAAYGSSKDIAGYKDLGLKKEQIFIVGKASKKHASHAVFLSSGYAAHLETLSCPGVARPVSGNAKLIIRKNCFSLPAHSEKRSSKRTSGDPQSGVIEGATIPGFARQESAIGNTVITVSELGHTIIQSGQFSLGLAARARGVSPRPKMNFESPR